ncbi:MAG: hypothetical protein ACHQIG_13940, partial [Acidimicrobiia bacterium]
MGHAVATRERAPVEPRPSNDRAIHDAPPGWLFTAVVVVGVVLRIWRALHNGPSFDESFTAMAGRRPLGDLFAYLARADSHPPLDYLLRMPLARAGAADFWLRSPSIVFSCAALALFAWWMRDRGWFGLLATALLACSTFQVLQGGEARMYALLQLLGVGAAVIGERWLRSPRAWHAWCLAAITLVALFDHVSGLLLGLGLLALAGLRADRDAWRLRGLLAGTGAVWLVLWGPVAVDQLGHSWSDWVPRTTATVFARTIAQQLVSVDVAIWPLCVAVVLGGVVLVRRDPRLGRVWIALGAVPFATAAVVGLATAFLLPRTLTLASWAPVLALAALLDAVRVRWRLVGRVVAVAVPVIVLLATATFLAGKTWDYDLSIAELERVAHPGDVVAVRPARY